MDERIRLAQRRPLRSARAVVGLLVVFALSSCQADIRVGVGVNRDGSGTVTVSAHLDRDAATSYAQYVRTSDLTRAGWKVSGPTPGAGGGVDFAASKPFANPAEAKSVVAELSGPAGPFRDLSISRQQSFFQTKTTFQGSVDLTCGLDCFSDPQLQQVLGGGVAGRGGIDPSTLQADAGIILDRVFQFEVAARLPGNLVSSNAPTQVGNGALWKARLGQKAVLSATARAWNLGHIVLAVVGALAALVAAGLALVKLRR